MAFQLETPLEIESILEELDPTGECHVTFRQGMAGENQKRDRLVFGGQRRTFTGVGMAVEGAVTFPEREEIECRLTMVGAIAFLDEEGQELFKFKGDKLAMRDTAFHTAWARLPPHVATMLHNLCLDANPDWDYRANPNAVAENSSD